LEPRSIARDLLLVDANDEKGLTELVVTYAVAPARRMWSLAEPRSDEGDDGWKRDQGAVTLDESTGHFAPVIAGLALWASLFPYSAVSFADRSDIARNPSSAFMDGSWHMAMFTSYGDVAELVHGLYLDVTDARPNVASRHPLPWPNPDALAELRRMQALLGRLVGPPSAWGDIEIRSETGLQHVDVAAAHDMDEILHRDVHRRLVWFGTVDPILPEETPEGEMLVVTNDGGVFPALVPETISGVIALDYTEGLALHRRVAVCGHCNRAVVLSNQQVARSRKGLAVYHESCATEHRLSYFRDYQRRREPEVTARQRPKIVAANEKTERRVLP
jgi:hypothetical protein